MMYPTDHTETPVFPRFVATCFSEDGVKYALPIRNIDTDSKSSLTKENYIELHNKKTTNINGKWWKPSVSWNVFDYMELSLRANEEVYCIDIDNTTITWDEIPTILRNCPYTKSRNKKLPHFLFRLGGVDNEKIKATYKGGFGSKNVCFDGDDYAGANIDFLASHIWERNDACIYNWDYGQLPIIEWNDIHGWLRPDERKKINTFAITKGDIRSFIRPVEESDDEGSTTGESVEEEPQQKPTPQLKPQPIKTNISMAATPPVIDTNKDNQKWKDYTNIILPLLSCYKKWYSFQLATFNVGISWNVFNDAMENDFNTNKKAGKYDAVKNKATWDSNNANHDKKVGWPTIRKMAMECDPVKALELNRKYNDTDLINNPFSTGMLADHFHELFDGIFIKTNKIVYWYNGVYWETSDEENCRLHNFVDMDYFRELTNYVNKRKYYFNKMKEDDKENIDTWNKKYDSAIAFEKNIQQLRNFKKRKDIIGDILNKITDNTIEFDKNPYLFAFENKIYDLEAGAFKKPAPTDYVSITTGYEYKDDYDMNRVKDLNKVIEEILPDKGVRDYYLQFLATGLCGIQMQNFIIATGGGGNGKSVINSLMMSSIGGYGYKLPSSLLCKPLPMGPCPEVANIDKKRFGLLQEPDSEICNSTMKELTGDDGLNARSLWQTKCKIELLLTLLTETNDELRFKKGIDNAITRRVRVVPFDCTAVEPDIYDSMEDTTNFLKKDTKYERKEFKEEHRQALFHILLPYFKMFYDNGKALMKQPDIVVEKSKKYMATSDVIYTWLCDNYQKSGTTTPLYLDALHKEFSYSSVFMDMNKADKREHGKGKFVEKIQKNVFLQRDFKDRDAYIGKTQIKKAAIVGWEKIPETIPNSVNTDEDEEIINE